MSERLRINVTVNGAAREGVAEARKTLADESNEILVSSVSAFEITTKYRLSKLPEFAAIAGEFPAILNEFAHVPLPITIDHAAEAGAIEHPHGDPYDRLLMSGVPRHEARRRIAAAVATVLRGWTEAGLGSAG